MQRRVMLSMTLCLSAPYMKEYSDMDHVNSRNCGEQSRSDARGREQGIEEACNDEDDSAVLKEQAMEGDGECIQCIGKSTMVTKR